jgi:ankyrin repeat protein
MPIVLRVLGERAPTEAEKKLLGAAERGGLQEATAALEEGADVNAVDQLERTPLLLAAMNGHKEMGQLLLHKGAEVNNKAY